MAGTADDYTLNLINVGLDATADIVIEFDNAETGFAVSKSSGAVISGDHIRIASTDIYFNTGFDWFFNDVSNSAPSMNPVPEPTTLAIMGFFGAASIAGSWRRRRRKNVS